MGSVQSLKEYISIGMMITKGNILSINKYTIMTLVNSEK